MTKLEAYLDNIVHHRQTGEFRPNRTLRVVLSQSEAALEYAGEPSNNPSGTRLTDLVIGAYCSLDACL